MKKTFTALAAILMLSACSDEEGARRALEAQGYTDVQITGWVLLGCSDGDSYKTGFRAVGPSGVSVEGVVCSSWTKGATVRTF